MTGLPTDEAQFWIVSVATLAAIYLVLRRVRVARRASSTRPCAACPAAPASERSAGRARAIAGVAAVVGLTATALAAEPVERRVAAMGTTLVVQIEGLDREPALALAEALVAAVAETESALSTWRPESELSRLNRTPIGEPLALERATWSALSDAVRCSTETGAAFDPAIGALVEAWGLRSGGRIPTDAEIEAARGRTGFDGLALDAPGRSATRVRDVTVEEGGFGKGAALAAALAVARERSPGAAVRLDLGGQLAWTGQKTPVVVGIADPRDRGREVLEVRIDRAEGSISTSSNSEHAVTVGGQRIGHLLDPRTGRPAPDFGSASSIGPDPVLADCRSTGLFVLGPEAGRAKVGGAESQGDNILLVVDGGRIQALVPSRIADAVRALAPEVEIERVSRMR